MVKQTILYVLLITAFCFFAAANSYAFELNGFTDVSYTKCDGKACNEEKGKNGNFAIGTLDFYVAHELENNLDVLVEFVIEQGSKLDLERLILGYTLSDALRIRVGRFHTPLGFWNTSYHHGVQLQPTINRPEFLSFEDDGGILPVHTVGAYLSGRLKTSPLTIEYGLMGGNGPKITMEAGKDILSPNNISDDSEEKSLAFNITLSPNIISGLKIGGSGHFARVRSDSTAKNVVDVEQTIFAGSLSYTLEGLDLMGEYYSISGKDKIGTAGTNTSDAYYGFISYTFAEKFAPYFLYENMSVKSKAGEDPYFIALGSSNVKKTIGGLKYNISYRSSIKAEYRKVEWGTNDWNESAVQWSLAF